MKITFPAALTLLFVLGKMVGWLDWSWWLVFCPLWIIPVFLLLYLAAPFVVVVLALIFGVLFDD